MPWPAFPASLAASLTPVDAAAGGIYLAASVTPLDSGASSITGYLLGFGPLGIIALALAWLIYKGWRLVPPDREAASRETARAEARADLLEERARVLAEKTRIEAERDEALRIARDQLVPVLMTFNASVSALLPILQEMAGRQGGHDRGTRRP